MKSRIRQNTDGLPARIFFVLAAIFALAYFQKSNAELTLLSVRSPKECPEGLTIESQLGKSGMIHFNIYVDAEKVAHADEMYKGRVTAGAALNVAAGDENVASVLMSGSLVDKRTYFNFSISPSAVKSSWVQLGVNLHEKDGMETIGGGVSTNIYLAGFAPHQPETKSGQAKP